MVTPIALLLFLAWMVTGAGIGSLAGAWLVSGLTQHQRDVMFVRGGLFLLAAGLMFLAVLAVQR